MAQLKRFRREFGREREPFDIMLHCPDAETVDDIRRLIAIESSGVTGVIAGKAIYSGAIDLREAVALTKGELK